MRRMWLGLEVVVVGLPPLLHRSSLPDLWGSEKTCLCLCKPTFFCFSAWNNCAATPVVKQITSPKRTECWVLASSTGRRWSCWMESCRTGICNLIIAKFSRNCSTQSCFSILKHNNMYKIFKTSEINLAVYVPPAPLSRACHQWSFLINFKKPSIFLL